MEAYLDEEEVVFSSPIARRHTDTTKPKDKDTQPPLKSPAKPAKLWALGKQTLDDERVFRFEEEESPAKQRGAHRGTKGKNTNSRVYSRWDYSSSDSENSQTTSDDEDNKENVSSNIKELIEIEEKLSKIKLEKEQESSTRLVCSFVVLFCVARVRPFFLSSLLISSLVHLVQYSSSSFLFYFTFSRFSVTSLIINTIPQHHNTTSTLNTHPCIHNCFHNSHSPNFHQPAHQSSFSCHYTKFILYVSFSTRVLHNTHSCPGCGGWYKLLDKCETTRCHFSLETLYSTPFYDTICRFVLFLVFPPFSFSIYCLLPLSTYCLISSQR